MARALGSFVLVVLASAAACGPPQRESAVLVALVPPPVAPVHVPTTVPLVAERVAPEPELAPTDVASGSGEVNAHAPLIGPILTATKGTVLVFHVWASWCYPCKRAMPELESLYVKYKTKGLSVVGLSVDEDENDAQGFLKAVGATFPIVRNSSLIAKWKPTVMPTTYVVDREGIVRFVHGGFHDDDTKRVEAEVKSLL